MTEHPAPRRTPLRPVAPFSRPDAIYFLAAAGAHLAHRAGEPEHSNYAAGAVIEALTTLGVSIQELKVATARGSIGQPTRWDDILKAEEK